MVAVSIRLTHIHAERLVEKPPTTLGVNIQISLPSAEPTWGSVEARIPFSFNLSTAPPAFTVTLRGYVEVKATERDIKGIKESVRKGSPPPEITNAVTNFTVFEAVLLARELGFPPILPLPTPPSRKQSVRQGPIGPV